MKLKSFFAIALLFAVSACSATGDLNVVSPKSQPIRPDATVALEVFALTEAGSPADVDHGVEAAKSLLYKKLSEDSPFASVVSANGSADYQMEIQLSEVDEVAPSAQMWLGAFAGVHSVAGDVKVIDNSNGLELTSFSARGDSARQSLFSVFSQSYTFDAAVQAFGDKVMEGLI